MSNGGQWYRGPINHYIKYVYESDLFDIYPTTFTTQGDTAMSDTTSRPTVIPFTCVAWERDFDEEAGGERWHSGIQLVFATDLQQARDLFIENIVGDDDAPVVSRLEVRVKPF